MLFPQGTTLTYIPTTAMKVFLEATDGVLDHSTTLASFKTKPTANITFTISNTPFTLSPDQYLVPQGQYDLFKLNSTSYYAWFSDGGGFGGVNFIIGQKVLEHLVSLATPEWDESSLIAYLHTSTPFMTQQIIALGSLTLCQTALKPELVGGLPHLPRAQRRPRLFQRHLRPRPCQHHMLKRRHPQLLPLRHLE